MAKYSTSSRYTAPALRASQQCDGLHVHADVSKKQSITTIGYAVIRVSGSCESPEVLAKKSGKIDEKNVTRAEAQALLAAVKETLSHRTDEHVFMYTDSRTVYRALYSGHPVSGDGPVMELAKLLPEPTEYSIINIHRDENQAHSLARHALKSAHRSTED